MAKYPIKQSLRNIADIISKQVGQIDADLKTKSSTYNNLKSSLQNMEKKQSYVMSELKSNQILFLCSVLNDHQCVVNGSLFYFQWEPSFKELGRPCEKGALYPGLRIS